MDGLERYFLWHGRTVARHPVLFILLSLALTVLAGLGLASFYEESDMTALWVPKGAEFRNNFEWTQEHFPKQLR